MSNGKSPYCQWFIPGNVLRMFRSCIRFPRGYPQLEPFPTHRVSLRVCSFNFWWWNPWSWNPWNFQDLIPKNDEGTGDKLWWWGATIVMGFLHLEWIEMDLRIPCRKDQPTASTPPIWPEEMMLQTSSRLTLILLLNGVPRIHFYDGDDCHELAKNFCQKYGLEKGLADLLEPWLQNTNTSPPKKTGAITTRLFFLIDWYM